MTRLAWPLRNGRRSADSGSFSRRYHNRPDARELIDKMCGRFTKFNATKSTGRECVSVEGRISIIEKLPDLAERGQDSSRGASALVITHIFSILVLVFLICNLLLACVLLRQRHLGSSPVGL
jgi:hypothetical protein